jgi:hypothetical protein
LFAEIRTTSPTSQEKKKSVILFSTPVEADVRKRFEDEQNRVPNAFAFHPRSTVFCAP